MSSHGLSHGAQYWDPRAFISSIKYPYPEYPLLTLSEKLSTHYISISLLVDQLPRDVDISTTSSQYPYS